MKIRDATAVWNKLNGLICLYKPADVSCQQVTRAVTFKICQELNELDVRPPTNYVSIEGNPSRELHVVMKPNLADHPAVAGPRYIMEDLRCSWSSYLGRHTSGVLILGLRSATKTATQIRFSQHVRTYKVKGLLGSATDTFYKDGKCVERSTFRSIQPKHLDAVLSAMQGAHQKKMFELCGVDIQSQTAYELATRGLIRPSDPKIPMIYGIKCVEFNSPEFTIEVHCINEYEVYLKALIHEIGMKLKSVAHCTGIQCVRHSYFTLDHALLRKFWTLQNFVTSIEECQSLLDNHPNIIREQAIELRQVDSS